LANLRQTAVLALDGGNSKTDVVLVGTDGSLLGSVRGGGINSQDAGAEATVHTLTDLVGQVTTDDVQILHTVACLANADLPEEEEELAEAVRGAGWSTTSTVVNDTFAILRAGLHDEPHWGTAVVCGAGINAVGVAPDGRVTRFLALGQLTGDWGGGYGLGREVMWHAIRGEDGRGPRTALTESVREFFDEDKVEDVAVGIHKGKIPKGDLNGLAPVLFQTSAAGDHVAQSIVDRLAAEISVLAITAMRRLDLTALATPVILGGGVITARDPRLLDGITSRLLAAAPLASIRVIDVPPVVGAALLALDHVGALPQAEPRLRTTYHPAPLPLPTLPTLPTVPTVPTATGAPSATGATGATAPIGHLGR
jgi:N-acetylglucosamine kinase-like BadF-type ATPase